MNVITKAAIADRLELLKSMTLGYGNHPRPPSLDVPPPSCALEAAAWVAGEEWGDHPECVSTTIAAMCRSFNDRCGRGPEADARRTAVLVPLIPLMLNTRGSAELEHRRVFAALDWSTRSALPRILGRTRTLQEWGPRLAALPEIVDDSSFRTARKLRREMANAAWAARDKAGQDFYAKYRAVAAEAAVAAVAVAAEAAEAEAAAIPDEVRTRALEAVKKAALNGGGWSSKKSAARAVFDEYFRGHPILLGVSLRDELDAEFSDLVRRLAGMSEAA